MSGVIGTLVQGLLPPADRKSFMVSCRLKKSTRSSLFWTSHGSDTRVQSPVKTKLSVPLFVFESSRSLLSLVVLRAVLALDTAGAFVAEAKICLIKIRKHKATHNDENLEDFIVVIKIVVHVIYHRKIVVFGAGTYLVLIPSPIRRCVFVDTCVARRTSSFVLLHVVVVTLLTSRLNMKMMVDYRTEQYSASFDIIW
jgi:hypothetical protein